MGISTATQIQKTADLTELVRTQIFQQVSMAQVAALLRYCPTLTLSDGDRLIVPGQSVDSVHILLQGRLRVFEGGAGSEPVGQILQGECVGLSSFVDRQPCQVSIVSEGASRLLVLGEERLLALINTPTVVSRNLLFMLMGYLRDKAARAPKPAMPAAPVPGLHNHIDAVTGLHNQRWLDETLDRLILRAATDRTPLSLVAVEVRDLPGHARQYGQEVLDLALREIAAMLNKTVRPTDLIARHANGGFVILLPATTQENAEMAAARIRDTVNRSEIVIPGACVLPPMKVDSGCCLMKAFVSGRKLVEDAIAALECNRAATIQSEAAAATTHHPIEADRTEPAPAILREAGAEMVEERSTGVVLADGHTAEPASEPLCEDRSPDIDVVAATTQAGLDDSLPPPGEPTPSC